MQSIHLSECFICVSFALIASKNDFKFSCTTGEVMYAQTHSKSPSRLFSSADNSLLRNNLLVVARAFGGTFANCNRNFLHCLMASSLSAATSSIKPISSASSVLNILPIINALSASRFEITFCIDAWNQSVATIPKRESFKPIVKFGHITRYSQLNASKHPPAGL